MLLQFGDVRIGGNDATFRGFSFADLNPPAVAAVLDMRFAGSVVPRYSFCQPGLAASLGVHVLAAFGSGAYNCFETRAGRRQVGAEIKES